MSKHLTEMIRAPTGNILHWLIEQIRRPEQKIKSHKAGFLPDLKDILF